MPPRYGINYNQILETQLAILVVDERVDDASAVPGPLSFYMQHQEVWHSQLAVLGLEQSYARMAPVMKVATRTARFCTSGHGTSTAATSNIKSEMLYAFLYTTIRLLIQMLSFRRRGYNNC